MGEDTINIEMTPEMILAMNDAEKLNLLIKIGFANHKAIQRQGELLEGNGKPGVCEMVRVHAEQIKWMWVAFTGVTGFIVGTLAMHLNK